jgi:hypothetical protein
MVSPLGLAVYQLSGLYITINNSFTKADGAFNFLLHQFRSRPCLLDRYFQFYLLAYGKYITLLIPLPGNILNWSCTCYSQVVLASGEIILGCIHLKWPCVLNTNY